jgi:hypothetical protein
LVSHKVVFTTLESVDFNRVTIAPDTSPSAVTVPVITDCCANKFEEIKIVIMESMRFILFNEARKLTHVDGLMLEFI